MKQQRKAAALLIAAALALGLTACGQKEEPQAEFDARLYVEGMIRGTYLGEFSQEYLDMVGLTESEAQSYYEYSIGLDAQEFAYIYNIEYPDDFYEEIREVYRQAYNYFLDYEMVAFIRYYDSDDLAVQVDIAPIDIAQRLALRLEQVMEPFFEKYPEEVQNALTTEEYKEFDAEWARLVVDTFRQTVYWAKNLEKQSVVVRLEKNEEGYYTISDESFQALHAAVIPYSAPTGAKPGPSSTPDPEESPTPEGTASPDPSESPGENDPVPPATASPLPEPEESAPPAESPERTE